MAARGIAADTRRLLRDPVLLGAVVVLWLLLALFVLYPLAELLARAFSDDGKVTLEPLLSAVADGSNRAAFFNSLFQQSVVEVWRRTGTGEAPRWQGATTENIGNI